MEYIPGVKLNEKLADGPLQEAEVLRLGMQLSDGLAAAHEHGVVHRDLKPGNLRLTSDGRLKILDFGLAKLRRSLTEGAPAETTLQTQGFTGTLAYMAPEQLMGEEIDPRTDIHGAGLVLYEMATGQRPFAEVQKGQLIGALMRRPPIPPTTLNPRVSAELERIIGKCLEKEKDAENRYQSARELAIDLRRLGVPSTTAMPVQKRERRTRNLILGGGALLVVVCVTLFTLNVGGWRDRFLGNAAAPRIRSLAVLPLENLSGDPDQEYFADGMTDEMITGLAKIGSLRVISRNSVMHYKGQRNPTPQIAKELNVDAVVEGTVQRSGNRVRISAQLIQANPEKHLWAESYERDLGDILSVQAEVTQAISREIRVTLAPAEQARVSKVRPVDPQSYQLYLQGNFQLLQDSERTYLRAIEDFEQAVKRDPSYAPAYAGLSMACQEAGGWQTSLPFSAFNTQAREAAQKALALDDGLAEAHIALGRIEFYEWNWAGADRELRRGFELNSTGTFARMLYENYLTYMGRFEESIVVGKQTIELDPLSPAAYAELGYALIYAGHDLEGLKQYEKGLELNPRFFLLYRPLPNTTCRKGWPMKRSDTSERRRASWMRQGPLLSWDSSLSFMRERVGGRKPSESYPNSRVARGLGMFPPPPWRVSI